MSKDASIVGDLINFRGMVYSPMNENGVIFLFGKIMDDLHMYVEEIKPGYPDCIARRFTGKGWERIRVEFEFYSSNFKQHKHDPVDCDVIVCWEHDWSDCPLEVIELKTEIKELENWPIKRPGVIKGETDFEKTIETLFERRETNNEARKWWQQVHDALVEHDGEIWLNVGKKYVGVYSPEKAFAFSTPRKKTIWYLCFTRGEPLPGVKIAHEKYRPRWGKFSIAKQEEVPFAIRTLIESHSRIKKAIKAGENTGSSSGGQPYPSKMEEDDEEEKNSVPTKSRQPI